MGVCIICESAKPCNCFSSSTPIRTSSASSIKEETKPLPLDGTIESSFQQFQINNPELEGLVLRFARQVMARGFKKYSMDAIFHRVRWHYNIDIERNHGDEFELNNNFTSRYARLIIEKYPEFDGFFELRKLKSK